MEQEVGPLPLNLTNISFLPLPWCSLPLVVPTHGYAPTQPEQKGSSFSGFPELPFSGLSLKLLPSV
jgi:hypothetical protein